jgi:hypothetical protein
MDEAMKQRSTDRRDTIGAKAMTEINEEVAAVGLPKTCAHYESAMKPAIIGMSAGAKEVLEADVWRRREKVNRHVRVVALALVAGFLLSSPVDAIPPARDGVLVQGPLFLDTCNDKDPIRHSACVGFIAGVANSYLNSGQTCMPTLIRRK